MRRCAMSERARSALATLAVVGALAVGALVLGGCSEGTQQPTPGTGAPIDGIRFLGESGTAAGFARADGPRRFVFPRDHGSHPDYRSEWWYFTGNLFTEAGRHYGFELTFFRVALAANAAPRESAWASTQVWLAHFAVTDTEGRHFIAAERSARGALGLAGAAGSPFEVFVEDWSAREDNGPGGPIRLSAKTDAAAIELELTGLESGIVLQGEDGLDRKGPEPGNASYYYSAPRLAARGTVTVAGERAVDVAGLAWLDREWGTSALSPGIEGWDWFGLELDDGRNLMFYRLRRDDGMASEWSGGTLVDATGRRERLGAGDVELEVLERWRSETTGVSYPVAWKLRVPRAGLELEVRPRLRDQEIDLSVRYWEGAVAVEGRSRGAAVAGAGYLELAGY